MGNGFEVDTDAILTVAGTINGHATEAGRMSGTASGIEVDPLSWGLMFNYSLHPVYNSYRDRAARNLASLQTVIEKGMNGMEQTARTYEEVDLEQQAALDAIGGDR